MSQKSVVPYFSEIDLISSVCKESFEDFIKEFWYEVPTNTQPLIWNWHLSYMAKELQYVAERVFKNLPKDYDVVINISPGSSKSAICSILYHPWVWTRMPTARFLTASHADTLCLTFASHSREVIRSQKYQACFPHVKLSDIQDTKGKYMNTQGGERLTSTVGGKSPLGFHATFQILDDILDSQKSRSETETRTAAAYISEVLPTRKVDKEITPTILVMQRLSFSDPTAVMLENATREGAGKVKHIRIPATTEFEIYPPELEEYYVNGLMDPKRLTQNALNQQRALLLEYGYAAQYGQDPIPSGGGMFHEEYFLQRKKSAPYDCKRVLYIDRASTQDGGCRTAGVLMAKDKEGTYYVEHMFCGQWEPTLRNDKIKFYLQKYRTKYGKYEPRIYVEAEGGSSGKDSFKGLVKFLAPFSIREDKVSGSKEVRAEPWSAMLSSLNVWLVEDGTWNVNEFIDEHLYFPSGKFLDLVDASSGAFNVLHTMHTVQGPRIYTLNREKKVKHKFLICTYQELETLTVEEKSLLICITEPSPYGIKQVPANGLSKKIDEFIFRCTNLNPKDYMEVWEKEVEPYGMLPEKLILLREDCKKLWAFLLRKRTEVPQVYVFVCDGLDKTHSIVYAICDCLGLKKESTIYELSKPDYKFTDVKPPNTHIYNVVKASRHMVM